MRGGLIGKPRVTLLRVTLLRVTLSHVILSRVTLSHVTLSRVTLSRWNCAWGGRAGMRAGRLAAAVSLIWASTLGVIGATGCGTLRAPEPWRLGSEQGIGVPIGRAVEAGSSGSSGNASSAMHASDRAAAAVPTGRARAFCAAEATGRLNATFFAAREFDRVGEGALVGMPANERGSAAPDTAKVDGVPGRGVGTASGVLHDSTTQLLEDGEAIDDGMMAIALAKMALDTLEKDERHPIEHSVWVDPRVAGIEGMLDRSPGAASGGAEELRGVVIFVPGLLGDRARLLRVLAEHGWVVAIAWPPVVERVLEVLRTSADADLEQRGALVARELDRTIRRTATLAQLQADIVHASFPALRERPTLLVCESMGAIAGVGIASTGLVRCDAAVFIVGGGGFLDVGVETALRRVLMGDLPVGHPRFRAGFDATSTLDPMRAAPSLRGAPMVVITADDDLIVPSARQEALWHALGEPPRYRWSGGHLDLFLAADRSIWPVIEAVEARLLEAQLLEAQLLEARLLEAQLLEAQSLEAQSLEAQPRESE